LFFPDEPWLDFHTLQSCHLVWDRDNYNFIAYDYGLEPPKPCMDSEPNYEDMPVTLRPDNGYFEAYDARKAAYWALFAGAHGHTYGANGVFQFWDGQASDIFAPRLPWHEALDLPGAAQMGHLRRVARVPPVSRPRPGLGTAPVKRLHRHQPHPSHPRGRRELRPDLQRCRAALHRRRRSAVGVDADGALVRPALGYRAPRRQRHDGSAQTFRPPTHGEGQDWVLVLDDAGRGFPPPGLVAPAQ
jgi:Protein of unknown function (DUF4038)